MNEKKKKGPEAVVREIKRQTCRKFTSEEKIRIVVLGSNSRLENPLIENPFHRSKVSHLTNY